MLSTCLAIAVILFSFSYSAKAQLIAPSKEKQINASAENLGEPVSIRNAFILGANYLKKLQADITEDNAGNGNPDADPEDGGWDWTLPSSAFTHSSSPSPANIYGTSALGLYRAYLATNDITYMTAMNDAANAIANNTASRSAATFKFLLLYQDLPGVTPNKFKDTVKNRLQRRFDDYGGAAGFVQYIRDMRYGQGYSNGIIPWDISAFAVVASMLNTRYPGTGWDVAAQNIAEVLWQDSYNNNPGYFKPTGGQNNGWDPTYANKNYWWYTLGISGLIDAFRSANVHTSEIPVLVNILLECRFNTSSVRGAFSGSYGANATDEDWQSTAYAVMTLADLNQTIYQQDINWACYYIAATEAPVTGGWIFSDNTHNPSGGGELITALSYGQNASVVYVDDNYTASSCGGHFWGYDAFNTVLNGIAGVDNGTVNIAAGTYIEGSPQIVINKNISFIGENKNTTILKPAMNTGNSGNARGWILVETGKSFNMSNMTLDGDGKLVNMGIMSFGTGTIDNNIIKNIGYNPSGPDYAGRGIAMYNGNMTVTNNALMNIGRIGIFMFSAAVTNAVVTGNTYTGKGTGNWLDYAFELSGGAKGTITNNIISDCKGIASLDGSTSAAILATDYWGPGTHGTVNGNIFNNNYSAIYVGYSTTDATTCNANNNTFNNNTWGVSGTNPSLTFSATTCWWGNETGPTVSSNPSGTGAKATTNVTYTPWVGQAQTYNVTNANLNIPIEFTQSNTEVTFTALPPGTNANMTVQRLTTPPEGVPAPPSGAGINSGVYLDINVTGLTNYTFSCNVVLDVSGIAGFSNTTEVMYFSELSNSWVGVNGTYDAAAQTYSFVTDHFTPFSFVNPLNPNELYISGSKTSPKLNQNWYPQVGMGTGTTYGTNDWTYTNDTARMYVVPAGNTGIFGAKFQVIWDKSKADIIVTPGNYWGNNVMYQAIDSSVGDQGRYCFNIASNDLTNMVPDTIGGKHLAVVKFAITKPGYIPVSITGTDFRYYHSNGDSTSGVFVTTNPGKLVFYLGDFERQTLPNANTGDGKINFTDLTAFSTAYWAWNTNPLYRAKYDIGPTNLNGSYWAMPDPDDVIEFEDLMIFAIGYGKFGAGQLPQLPLQNPIKVTAMNPQHRADGSVQVPVKVEGNITDIRGFSLSLSHSDNMEYHGVEKAGEMLNGVTFLAGKNNGTGIVMIDGAVISDEPINQAGTIVNVLFKTTGSGKLNAVVAEAKLRDTRNNSHIITLDNESLTEIPTVFALEQNYPNPFNPVTMIKYQLPKVSNVTLKVYDLTGREVMTLINGLNQEAGYYQIEFNAKNYASGVYFYKIEAGDFVSTKKMILVK